MAQPVLVVGSHGELFQQQKAEIDVARLVSGSGNVIYSCVQCFLSLTASLGYHDMLYDDERNKFYEQALAAALSARPAAVVLDIGTGSGVKLLTVIFDHNYRSSCYDGSQRRSKDRLCLRSKNQPLHANAMKTQRDAGV